jgi:hypothetical protein
MIAICYKEDVRTTLPIDSLSTREEAVVSNAPGDYQSYLLRLWRVRTNKHTWRASLENVETGEVSGFTTMKELIEFLQDLDGEEQKLGKEACYEINNKK